MEREKIKEESPKMRFLVRKTMLSSKFRKRNYSEI